MEVFRANISNNYISKLHSKSKICTFIILKIVLVVITAHKDCSKTTFHGNDDACFLTLILDTILINISSFNL